jgi:hypothetical protein
MGNPNPLHPTFSVGEQTPGPGTETVVAFEIPQTGIQTPIMCIGYCIQNGIGCLANYTDEKDDSCGVGATCCSNIFSMAASPPTILPYPVGNFTCEVDVDGEVAGVSAFTIDYPPTTTVNGVTEECPVSPPVDGAICAGWVEQGSKCTGFNATQMCTCEGAAWVCK